MNTINPALEQSVFGHIELQGPQAIELQLEIAGIGARSHAFLIDWHIRLLLALTWLIAIGFSLFSLEDMQQFVWDQASSFILLFWFAPAAIIYLLYHPLLEIIMAGRTPGKRMAGIRIVNLQGMTPSASAILMRNLFRLLDGLPGLYILGLATVALTKHQVRIGDLASGLILVYDNKISQKQLRTVTDLALTSDLSSNDQALLLDLLERWKQLDLEIKIALGEKFLNHINQPLQTDSRNKITRSREILSQLQLLTNSHDGQQ